MKVVLLNLVFEICENVDKPLHLEYYAKRSQTLGKSYASVVSEDLVPPSPTIKEANSLTVDEITEYRGERQLKDICIETYNSEDYNRKAIEEFLSVNSISARHFALTDNTESDYEKRVAERKLAGYENVDYDTTKVTQDEQKSEELEVGSAEAKGDKSVDEINEPVETTEEMEREHSQDAAISNKTAIPRTELVKSKGGNSRADSLKGEHSRGNSAEKSGSLKSSRESSMEKSVSKEKETDGGVRPKSQSPTPKGTAPIHFYSGNPMVEKVKGILHIYKDNHATSLAEDGQRSELICMLAVPAKYTIHDLLKFNAPCLQGIEYMRVIRDSSPNQYMVLVKFRNQMLADEYYQLFNNTTFNSIESDICHLVYVGQVEMLKESENACMPMPGMTELPNCPVCLERMDESVDGILTILCNHSFHTECLSQWFDTSCPVCRYCQTPEEVADSRCMKCGSQESLWICLICGNIGCGRYVGKHAYRHFQETQHTYAMELGNNKVWDYIGDNYVHRLVQNKSDGKLVQVDEGGNPVQDEKLDALNLEYTYLLTNQLESQRLYFEEKMEEVENTVLAKVHLLEEENVHLAEECSKLHCAIDVANKDKQHTEKKCSHLQTRLNKVLHDLQEEREMNKCLQRNQDDWKKRVQVLESQMKTSHASRDKEIQELQEQLRDVMFYVEAQGKLQKAEGISQEELQDGHVIVAEASGTSAGKHTRRKKQR